MDAGLYHTFGSGKGVRPFLSDKYDLTQHPNFKYTADFDKKYTFDIEKYLNRRMKLKKDDVFDVVEAFKWHFSTAQSV